ncbi:MAG: WG repeat-containing protein, partial [Candidatus Poribacteria bacterium]|nr:WG repeat-containing protein [Candidatus Poribacteria bacterium]
MLDQTGELVLEPQFDQIEDFSDQLNGLARVNLGGKWNSRYKRVDGGKYGLVDQTGKLVLEPQFDQIENFNEKTGLARVNVSGKWGLIDQSGIIVLQPDYIDLQDYSDQLGGMA